MRRGRRERPGAGNLTEGMGIVVVHVTPWEVPCGIARHLSYWLRRATQHTPLICAEEPPSWLPRDRDSYWRDFDFSVVPCWRRGHPGGLRKALQIAMSANAEIIHLQWDPSFFPAPDLDEFFQAAERAEIQTVATVHTLHDSDLYVRENKALLRGAASIVAGTPGLAGALGEYARRFSIRTHSSIDVVPLAYPDQVREEAMGTRAFESRPVVLTWGMTGGVKGMLQVLRAVHVLRERHPQATYVVAGAAITGEQRQTVSALREADQSVGALRLIGEFLREGQVRWLCRQADVICLNHQATHHSSSGTVALSVASGTPVVVSDSPMFDLYREADAVLTAGKTFMDMADALVRAIRIPDERARQVEAINARASARSVADAYEYKYSTLTWRTNSAVERATA